MVGRRDDHRLALMTSIAPCSGQVVWPGGRRKVRCVMVDARIATFRDGPSFLAAIKGRLSVTDGFVSLDGTLIAFREGTATWDGTRLTYQGETYAIGDVLDLGGGGAPLSMARTALRGFVAPEHLPEDASVIIVAS